MDGSDSARWVSHGYTNTLESLDSETIGNLYPIVMNTDIGIKKHVFVMRSFNEENMAIVDVHYYIDEYDVDDAKAVAERMVFKMHARKLQRDIDELKVRLARTEALIEDSD